MSHRLTREWTPIACQVAGTRDWDTLPRAPMTRDEAEELYAEGKIELERVQSGRLITLRARKKPAGTYLGG